MGVGIVMTAFESLGFAFREQSVSDYGIDAHAELIRSGKPTGQLLGIQIKSGPSYFSEPNNVGFVFRTDQAHVEYWQKHALPVLICICDVETKIIYWQVVNHETAVSTGKGYKFIIPKNQIIDKLSKNDLCNLVAPIVTTDRYTILKTDDVSHGMVKRYSIKVVVNGRATKAEIAAIVRQVTIEGQKSRYYRNHLVEDQWGNSDAHIVWTYIYLSAEDHHRCNHICKSQWIHKDLEQSLRPLNLEGENVGDNIIVDWNREYDSLSKFYSENTLSKEEYLNIIRPLTTELKSLLSEIEGALVRLSNNDIDENTFLMLTKNARTRLDKIYFETQNLSFSPYECYEVDMKLGSFLAYLHNIYIFYSDNGQTKWDANNRLIQSLQNRTSACETLQHLEYELSKVC